MCGYMWYVFIFCDLMKRKKEIGILVKKCFKDILGEILYFMFIIFFLVDKEKFDLF